MDEFKAIEIFLRPLATKASWFLNDDAALLPDIKGQWIISTDTVVEGTHFFQHATHEQMIERAMGSSLSDMAAMGAMPRFFLCNATLAKNEQLHWMAAAKQVLERWCKNYTMALLGGDTTVGSTRVLSITVLGTIPKNVKPIVRHGAMPGDTLWMTGTIGDAALGLCIEAHEHGLQKHPWVEQLSNEDKNYLKTRYYNPTPRIQAGIEARHWVHAGMDISDGLFADSMHIAKASNIAIHIEQTQLPLSTAVKNALRQTPELIEYIVAGGDDYELLWAAPSLNADAIDTMGKNAQVTITPIGKVEKTQGQEKKVKFTNDGKEVSLKRQGYKHF